MRHVKTKTLFGIEFTIIFDTIYVILSVIFLFSVLFFIFFIK